jgi:Zn-dependent metalloprotease
MVFGRDYAAPMDVTAHEVTHGITNNEVGLPYEGEHGALSEALSDIFAPNVDPDDWEIGEDLPDGAIRDMEHPERFGDEYRGVEEAFAAVGLDGTWVAPD